jgi:hypothetical protein
VIEGVTGRRPFPDPEAFRRVLGEWGIGPDTQVVAYDAQNGLMAASRVWLMLRWMGHEAVAVLDGGIQAWLAAGLPVDDAAPGPNTRAFTGVPSASATSSLRQTGTQCRRISCPIGALPSTRHSRSFSSALSMLFSCSGHDCLDARQPHLPQLPQLPQLLRALSNWAENVKQPAENVQSAYVPARSAKAQRLSLRPDFFQGSRNGNAQESQQACN